MCGNGRASGDLTPPVLTFQFWPQAWGRCGQMAENSAVKVSFDRRLRFKKNLPQQFPHISWEESFLHIGLYNVQFYQ
jgi:hypothetical protein